MALSSTKRREPSDGLEPSTPPYHGRTRVSRALTDVPEWPRNPCTQRKSGVYGRYGRYALVSDLVDGSGRAALPHSPPEFPGLTRASHPADKSRTTHVEAGTGHRARTWNYPLNITFGLILQFGSSLVSCDLASHRLEQQSAGRFAGGRFDGRAEAIRTVSTAFSDSSQSGRDQSFAESPQTEGPAKGARSPTMAELASPIPGRCRNASRGALGGQRRPRAAADRP